MPTPGRAPSHARAPRRHSVGPARTLPRLVAALILPALLDGGALAAPVEAAGDAASSAARFIVMLDKGASVDRAVSRATSTTGKAPNKVFRHALKGYATKLTPGQRRKLAADPAVAAIVPDTVVQLAAQSTPVGIKRVRATAAPATHIDGIDRSPIGSMPTSRSSTQASRPATPTSTCVAASTARARAARRHGPTTTATGRMSRASPRPWTTASGSWAPHPAPACGPSACSGRTASRSTAIVCGIDWVTAQRDPNDPRSRDRGREYEPARRGGDDRNCGYTNPRPEHRAICASVAQGITYVVAAGNDSTSSSAWRPASYDEVITVSAIADFDGVSGSRSSATCTSFGRRDVDDTFADFSNFGADVDIIAPGVCVRST